MPKPYIPLTLKHYTATFKPMEVPPITQVDQSPLVCVTFSKELVPYLLGLLEQYRWSDALKGTDAEIEQALTIFEELRGLLMRATDDCEKGEVCRDYMPDSDIIEWQPQNPFSQPDYIPPGYKEPPWKVVTDPIAAPILGLQIGDVMSGLLGLPLQTPALGQGLARFTVTVEGPGTVELHLITMPFGGTAIVTVDDNPLSTTFIDLIRNINLTPPENSVVNINEFVITGNGAHHVDVTLIPSFAQTVTFVGYGGGLRKVNLCGFEPMQGRKQPLLIRTKPSDNCVLQQSLDGGSTWSDVYSARQCAVDTVKDMVSKGEIPGGGDPALHQCFDLDLTVPANQMAIIPLAISSGWSLQFTDVKGTWHDGNISHYWQCKDGHQFALGTCTSNFIAGQSGDPIPATNHMSIILRLPDGSYAAPPLDGSLYVVPQDMPEGNTFLLANDDTLSDNQGSMSLHLLACNEAGIAITYLHGTGPALATIGEEFTVTPETNTTFGGFKWINLEFSTPVTLQWIGRELETRAQDAIRFIWQDSPDTNYSCGQDNGQPFTDTACLADLNTHMGEQHTASGLWVVDNGTGDFTFKIVSVP